MKNFISTIVGLALVTYLAGCGQPQPFIPMAQSNLNGQPINGQPYVNNQQYLGQPGFVPTSNVGGFYPGMPGYPGYPGGMVGGGGGFAGGAGFGFGFGGQRPCTQCGH